MSGAPTLKELAASTVAHDRDVLIGLSHRIHGKPELGFEEESACAWCAEQLADAGFSVETGICDLPTAFAATAGSGPFVLAICAEYDALPGIGHACGHNVIASAAIGAGRALAPIADDLGITIKVLGTPAEEGGGGKILMMERGGFDGLNAAMMVHPAPGELDLLHLPPRCRPRLVALIDQLQALIEDVSLRQRELGGRLMTVRAARRTGPAAHLADFRS